MVLKCPVCQSEEITTYMGGQFGKYICKKCGYIGPLVIETNKQSNKHLKQREKIENNRHDQTTHHVISTNTRPNRQHTNSR
jgi:hypothetical protein